MIILTPKIIEKMEDKVETSDILQSIDHLDQIRYILADAEDLRPPQIRHDLLNLHGLLFKIIREKYTPAKDDGDEIFELVDCIEDTLNSIIENAEKILEIIVPIQNILLKAPTSDEEIDNEEEENDDE